MIPQGSTALGVVLATVTAVTWAGQYVCIRMGTRTGSVSDAMVISLSCNVLVLVPLAAVVHYPDYGLTPLAVAAFAGGGLAGSLLSRLCQYKSTEIVGASRTAPTVSSSALISALLAVALLGETLTAAHLLGIVLIVAAIAVISWEMANDGGRAESLRDAGKALTFPLLAAAFLGVEPILLKVGLAEGTPTLVGVAIMAGAATVGFLAYRRLGVGVPARRALLTPALGWFVGAGLAGTAALLAYFGALSVAPVVIVIPLIQTAPLVVVVLSLLFVPRRLERVTWRLGAAAATVVVGAILVSISG